MPHYDDYSREELVRLLEARDRRDFTRFGLVWETNEVEREKALNGDFVALDLDAALSTAPTPGPEGEDAAWRKLIIEGDNFDALRFLRMAYAGRVKCICIDPPCNTGNRDFVYNDRYVDKDDSWRHSRWCEFMHQRLTLAKELLAEDEVIFVHIDDNEIFALGMLMNAIFGEGQKLACFVWQTDGNFDNQAKVKNCHEYILAYTASLDRFPAPPIIDQSISKGSKLFKPEIRNTIVKNGPKNPASSILLPKGFPASFQEGTIPSRSNKWPTFKNDVIVSGGCLVQEEAVSSGWSSKDICENFIKTGFSSVPDSKGQLTRFEISQTGAIEAVKERTENQSYVVSVIRGFGTTQSQSTELSAAGIKFSFPKPVPLLHYLISMVSDKDAIVLDFFAGSGTTAMRC